MGLLDEILGSLAGQAMGSDPRRQVSQPGAGGTDMSKLMIAMLPLVLSMMSNRGSTGAGPSGASFGPSGGGGLGDILGQVLGGSMGGRGGGLGGLLEQLQRAGFGAEADSWVSSGPNKQ